MNTNRKEAHGQAVSSERKLTRYGFEGPLNKRLIATFESHEALFRWLHEHAVQRGYGRKRSFFLADGSDHIWRLQKQYFPNAVPCMGRRTKRATSPRQARRTTDRAQ